MMIVPQLSCFSPVKVSPDPADLSQWLLKAHPGSADLSQWLIKTHPNPETDMKKHKCAGSLKPKSDLSQWLLKFPPDPQIDKCDKGRNISGPNGHNLDDNDEIFLAGEELCFLSAKNEPHIDKVELDCDNVVDPKMVIKCDDQNTNTFNAVTREVSLDQNNEVCSFSCVSSQLFMDSDLHQVKGGRNYPPVFSAFDWDTNNFGLLKKHPPDWLSALKHISWQPFKDFAYKDFHCYDGVMNYPYWLMFPENIYPNISYFKQATEIARPSANWMTCAVPGAPLFCGDAAPTTLMYPGDMLRYMPVDKHISIDCQAEIKAVKIFDIFNPFCVNSIASNMKCSLLCAHILACVTNDAAPGVSLYFAHPAPATPLYPDDILRCKLVDNHRYQIMERNNYAVSSAVISINYQAATKAVKIFDILNPFCVKSIPSNMKAFVLDAAPVAPCGLAAVHTAVHATPAHHVHAGLDAASPAPSGPVAVGYGGSETSHQSVSKPYGEQIADGHKIGPRLDPWRNHHILPWAVVPVVTLADAHTGSAHHVHATLADVHAVYHAAPVAKTAPACSDEPSPYNYNYAAADPYNYNYAAADPYNYNYAAADDSNAMMLPGAVFPTFAWSYSNDYVIQPCTIKNTHFSLLDALMPDVGNSLHIEKYSHHSAFLHPVCNQTDWCLANRYHSITRINYDIAGFDGAPESLGLCSALECCHPAAAKQQIKTVFPQHLNHALYHLTPCILYSVSRNRRPDECLPDGLNAFYLPNDFTAFSSSFMFSLVKDDLRLLHFYEPLEINALGTISVSQTVFHPARNDYDDTSCKMVPCSGPDFASNNAIVETQFAVHGNKLLTHFGRNSLVLSEASVDISLKTGIEVELLHPYISCVNTYKLVLCYWTKDNMLHNHYYHLHWNFCADRAWNSIDPQNDMISHMNDAGLAVMMPVKNCAD